MQKVFVTGANGLVGSNLCIKLHELGYEVTGLVRENSNLIALKDFKGKLVLGDILDEEKLSKLLEGFDFLFHTAGLVSFDNRKKEQLFRVNVEGTRKVMSAALNAGIKKVIHTSSVAAIGISHKSHIADETVEYNRFKYRIAYSDSKHFGEIEVQKAVHRGLDAVIVNPASVVGQRDVYLHFGILLKILRGKLIVPYIKGGMCVVGADDVVDGEIAALKFGKTGERYIIGSENISFKDLFREIGKIVGASKPNVYIPIGVIKTAASLLELLSNLNGKPPILTKAHVVAATLPHYFSFEKAKRELGFAPHPISAAIRKAYEWYIENDIL
jgi:dihydroflavonol-4-reductase